MKSMEYLFQFLTQAFRQMQCSIQGEDSKKTADLTGHGTEACPDPRGRQPASGISKP
jgi:hypothetical protein